MDHLPMPKFGPLAGLRVVFSGIEIAGPFAGQMFAEWGAEVIWIENVAWADTIRVQPNYPQLSRRNLHALSLNIFKDEGREAFLKLMETTDIFIEASKGPAFSSYIRGNLCCAKCSPPNWKMLAYAGWNQHGRALSPTRHFCRYCGRCSRITRICCRLILRRMIIRILEIPPFNGWCSNVGP